MTDHDDLDPNPRIAPDSHGWWDRGACVGVDPALFFPARGESTTEAKRICRACPVREECLDHALTPPLERFGIWGGLSERERRRIRTQRLRAPGAA